MNLGADDQIVDKIFQVSQSEKNVIHRQLKTFGLNAIQARALNFIAEHPGTIQKSLSEHLGKPGATTTNILKVLETSGLIVRRVQETNERQKQLYLSPAGQETAAAVRQIFIEMENRIRALLANNEQELLLRLLDQVQAGLANAQ